MKWRSLEESRPGEDLRSLREIFDERKTLIAKYVPADIQRIHSTAVEKLQSGNAAGRALPVGATAPAFALQDHQGNPVSSAALLANGPLVIIFFRGRWCPFCVGQLEAMNLALPSIQQAGASLVAISPQTVRQSYFMVDQHKLRFPLLSDAGNAVARQFGLSYRVADDQKEIYRRAFVNLPLANGDEGWELPIPATYIISSDGSIVYASANPDYTDRPEPADIVRFLLGAPGSGGFMR
jgi:peroxiredoxin